MRRMLAATQLTLAVFAAIPRLAQAVVDADHLCPGTGVECVVSTEVKIVDPQGVDVRPLTLHVTSGGGLQANDAPGPPLTPLTIKAGALIIDKGASITGDIIAANANSLTVNVDSFVTVSGLLQASALRFNSTGGDGGRINVTAPGLCQINGKVLAMGSRSTSVGGAGGDISLDCGSIAVAKGSLVEASASGPGGTGGNVSLAANTGGLTIAKGASLRAFGEGSDGGAVSLSTDGSDINDGCSIAGKVMVDGKVSADLGGTGGGVDISCGGNVAIDQGAFFTLNGSDGGGTVDVFSGANFTMVKGTSMRVNSSGSSAGTIDIIAGIDATIGGKLEARSGGEFGNDGYVSVTNGRDLIVTKGAQLNASAGRKAQQAGQIVLSGGIGVGTPPQMTIEEGVLIKVLGHGSGFGAIDVDLSGAACTIAGKILADGEMENGVAVGVECDSFALTSKGLIQANSKAGNPSGTFGGSLTIDTTGEQSGGNPGPCTIDGIISLKGGSATVVDALAGTSYFAPGRGGTVDAVCGQGLSIGDRGLVDVSATGTQSVGGQVTLSANSAAHIRGTIKAKASGGSTAGGQVAMAAPDMYVEAAPGAIDAGGQNGGTIEVTATAGPGASGVVTIDKALNTKGSAFGGNVVVRGCTVTVGSLGWLRADGSSLPNTGGLNKISAQNALTVSGKLTAANGQNLLVISTGMTPLITGLVTPAASTDASLSHCP